MGELILADLLNSGAVGRACPCAYDDLLGAAHLTHKTAEQQSAKVVGKDVDDHIILKIGDHGAEHSLVAPGAASDTDVACALHNSLDIGGDQIEESSARTLKAVAVALYAVQQNTGLLKTAEGILCVGHQVKQSDLAACQLDVCSAGLADSTAAQNGNRHIFQV